MTYIYESNLDPLDRSTQLEIQMQDGSTAILRMGHTYDLTATELSRARQFIVLTSSVAVADEEPIGIEHLPVKGNPANGQVPVWDSTQGVFVPGAGGGGGGVTLPIAITDVTGLSAALTASNGTVSTGTSVPGSLPIGETYYQLDGSGNVIAEYVGAP